MKRRSNVVALVLSCLFALAGCGGANENAGTGDANAARNGNANNNNAGQTVNVQEGAPIAENAYKAQITLAAEPSKLKRGQKETIKVRVKNASDSRWVVSGADEGIKGRVAVGNNWLDAGGQLLTNMDGRYGLPADLEAGEEVEVPLVITAPKAAGEYILELDLVQEGITWFHDKGSPTLKTKVRVE